ncbi:MAG: ATP-binding cassette domain-containing protein [Candidatus Promineifilaceae bacterium]
MHLRVNQISKSYGNLQALNQISFSIESGEVVGLSGRSGAGATTLLRILAGLARADQGHIAIDGQTLTWPFSTQQYGIGVIHQEPELAEQLSVTDNIFLGNEIGRNYFGNWFRIPHQDAMDTVASRILTQLDAPFIPLHEKAGNLSREQKQLVSIAHVMARPNKIILVDSPTPLLSLPYQQKLLQLIRNWRKENIAILFTSNNLDHLFAVSDRLLVLRDGQLVASKRSDETTREEVVTAVVGATKRDERTPTIWAMDSYHRAREQAELLRHNQRLLERDLQARDALNQQLVEQLAEQVQALDSANLALQDAQRRLLTEREQERKHLAREIHDQAIQDLLSLNYELEEIEDRVSQKKVVPDDIVEIRQSIRTLVEDLRRLCGNLRPPTIDSLGLDAALRSYVREWERRTGIIVALEVRDDFGRLPESLELSIFRIVQETLNNVWKHAEATEAEVKLESNSPRLMLITITDNGRGLDKSFNLSELSSSGHYGLLGISERVALLQGRLRFANQGSGGLLVQIEIPHPRMI